MQFSNSELVVSFAPSGAIHELAWRGNNLIRTTPDQTLFVLQMRDADGKACQIASTDFGAPVFLKEKRNADTFGFLQFSGAPQMPEVRVTVTLRLPETGSMSYWRIQAEDIPVGNYCEWIDFPRVRVPNDLVALGGEARFFWPAYEGVLYDDLRMREHEKCFSSSILEYPLTGVGGYYPGPCPMQFQAYLNPAGSLYMGCHDNTHAPKGLDVCFDDESETLLRPYLQHFTGTPYPNRAGIAYEVVLGGFSGDWQDACLIYRDWMEANDPTLPVKLEHNADVPAWLTDSPVILAYPVKGDGYDTGSLTGNEYFPYNRALPTLEKYAAEWDSPVMSLLMHWEGTAPWAPPYVWPPFGGEQMLRDFASELHQRGFQLGVYCSGIAWTQTSSIDPRYDRTEQFERENLATEMCLGPAGEMFARVCNGGPGKGQRIGYELCPAREWTRNTVCGEIASIIDSGVDYLQYFDQNQGCSAPLCYAEAHGHPKSPGTWLTKAMQALLEASTATIRASGKAVVLGCENAAAEPYIRNLQLNDLRNHLAWCTAQPVPAYSLLFHEYVNNFTGNGVCLAFWFDRERSPEFIHYRTAYGFISGEVLSAILKSGGEMHWSWVCKWDEAGPDQPSLTALIGNLNRWRRGRAHDFLVFGRMEKDLVVECDTWTLHFANNHPDLPLPLVVSSHWTHNGREVEILANFRREAAQATVHFGRRRSGFWYDSHEANAAKHAFNAATLTLEVGALNACLIEFAD